MFNRLTQIFNLQSSEDSYDLALSIMILVDYLLKEDMLNQYYHIPERIYRSYVEEWTLEDLKRQDAANTDQSQNKNMILTILKLKMLKQRQTTVKMTAILFRNGTSRRRK